MRTQPVAGKTYERLWVYSRDQVVAPVDESFTFGGVDVLTILSKAVDEDIDVSIAATLSGGQGRTLPAGSLTLCDGDTLVWGAGWPVNWNE